MSSFARLMSAVRVGLDEEPESTWHAATIEAHASSRTIARRIARRIGSLLGGSAHLCGRVLRAPFRRRCAEALVVDVLGDRRMLPAGGALRIAPEPHLAEASLERVVQQVTPDERLADPEKELHG